MKKIKAKTNSLPVFNGRVSDSSPPSNSEATFSELGIKNKKSTSFVMPPVHSQVYTISTSNTFLAQESAPTVALENKTIPSHADIMHNIPVDKKEKTINIAGIELANYEKIKVVGQGSFGIAILYRRKADNHHIVFKQINLSDLRPAERDLAMNEVEVFSKLHHPNIISYLGSFIKENTLLIEMEYADGGTLAHSIAARKQKEHFPERHIITIFEQISSAINYMHAENILHRDLKTANVFLNGRGIVKIGDFGISKIMNTKIHAQTVLGTPYYFSPEMCEGKEYDHKSDIWALGCILGEMCCLKKTFAASNLSDLVSKIMAGSYTPLPAGYSSGMHSLLSNLLQVEAVRRPTATEILEYWIPLIFRNLGKHRGFNYEEDVNATNGNADTSGDATGNTSSQLTSTKLLKTEAAIAECIKSCMNMELPTAQTETKKLMNAETVAPSETIGKRSVLYQLKSFGNSFSLNPIQLPSKACIRTVATSDTHFVVVNEDGSVYTWGEGTHGQLGLSSLETWKHYPSRMESVRNYHIVSACAGEKWTLLLTQNGRVLSCGDNSKFALGHDGDARSYHCPKVIAKLQDAFIEQIAAGVDHALALSRDGTMYSWGTSFNGALGLGILQRQQKQPTPIPGIYAKSKVAQIYCGPDASAILFSNGQVYICGSNEYNKLGFNKTSKVMSFKKIQLPHKVQQVCLSSTHSVFLIEGGYVITMGRNSEGQRGIGHCRVVETPTLVDQIRTRHIKLCKCNDLCTIVVSSDNVISFWGTRNGLPEIGANHRQQVYTKNACNNESESELDLGSNTAAFTNFLASVYKSELKLESVDILALYSSEEQREKGYYVHVAGIYPLPHSILVLVDTTTPLVASMQDLA